MFQLHVLHVVDGNVVERCTSSFRDERGVAGWSNQDVAWPRLRVQIQGPGHAVRPS